MNSSEVNRNISYENEYISLVKSDMSWEIVNLDESDLTLTYLPTGKILRYKRVK